MQMVVDVKICSRLVSRMVNIPILGRFHRYVRGIEVTILSNSAVKYKPNTTSLPFKRPLVYGLARIDLDDAVPVTVRSDPPSWTRPAQRSAFSLL
jgi:hypothetical protein